jgi:hypothetical protein
MQLELSYQQLSSRATFAVYAERKDVKPKTFYVEEYLSRVYCMMQMIEFQKLLNE